MQEKVRGRSLDFGFDKGVIKEQRRVVGGGSGQRRGQRVQIASVGRASERSLGAAAT